MNLYQSSLIATITIGFLALSSCNSEEPTPVGSSNNPVITMNGNTDMYVSLNETYTEPGAVASDIEDGNISSSLSITGTVNTDEKGVYPIHYNVSDSHGNPAVQLTRNVHVVNDADFLIGTYVATPDCGATPTAQYDTDITTSNSVNNKIFITKVIYGTTGQPFHGMLNGNNIDIPVQTHGPVTTSANGQISGNGFTLDAESSHHNMECDIVHVKQ